MTERASPDDAPRDWPESGDDAPTPRLSREQAQALRARQPSVSPWRVVAAQGIAGVLCCALAWVITQRPSAVWSALYGAAASVLPSALLVRGMTRGTRDPAAAAVGFMFWEMVKVGVAIAMLAIATRVVPQLSWPALLATMLVCLKVNWLALLWRGR